MKGVESERQKIVEKSEELVINDSLSVSVQEESDHGSFTFVDPQPCSLHEVQVRCSCNSAFMSDWSESYRKTSTGAGKSWFLMVHISFLFTAPPV